MHSVTNKIVLLLFGIMFFQIISNAQNIEEAQQAFRDYKVDSSSMLLTRVLNYEKASEKDRARAARMLSFISWRFQSDIKNAEKYTEKALTFNSDQFRAITNLLDYQIEAKKYKLAMETANCGLKIAETQNEQSQLQIAIANLILQEAITNIKLGKSFSKERALDGLNMIAEVNQKEPGQLTPSKIQLGLGLLCKNEKYSAQAWRSFFRIAPEQEVPGNLQSSEQNIKNALFQWSQNPLNQKERESLILGLANSTFYEYAYLMEKIIPCLEPNNNRTVDVLNYYEFCSSLESITYQFYKNYTKNNEDTTLTIIDDLWDIHEGLWEKLSWEGEKPEFEYGLFYDEMFKRFGTKPFYRELNGYPTFFVGHTIFKDDYRTEQYGYKYEITALTIDNTFSNNYAGWYFNRMIVGGWNLEDNIVRMRQTVADDAIRMWNRLTDEKQRAIWLTDIDELSVKDDSILKLDENGFLPGLNSRLSFSAYNNLLDEIKETTTSDYEFRLRFISMYDSIREASTMHHEARHGIDIYDPELKHKKLSEDKAGLEYTAKLSAIYFSDYPIIVFSDLNYVRAINASVPHDIANKKLVDGVVLWIDEHKERIKGFNYNRPTLLQLDLLTRVQLKEAVQTLDPLANH